MRDAGVVMFSLFTTAWLHAVALFVLVWVVERVQLLREPALREAAWRAVLIVPLISASLQVFALGGSFIGRQILMPAQMPEQVAAGSSQAADVSISLAQLLSWPAIAETLGWAWLGWAVLMGLRLAIRRYRLHRYVRRLSPVSQADTLHIADALRARAGVRRLRLLEDSALCSPIALAMHDVVLPVWTHALSAPQRTAMLAHEICHLSRRDPYWLGALDTVAAAALVPHARLANRRLEDLAEDACDGWAAQQSGNGVALAECLAACLERGLAPDAAILSVAMAHSASPVVARVQRLLAGRASVRTSHHWRGKAMMAGVLAFAVVALPGFTVGPSAQPVVAAAAQPVSPAPRVVSVAAEVTASKPVTTVTKTRTAQPASKPASVVSTSPADPAAPAVTMNAPARPSLPAAPSIAALPAFKPLPHTAPLAPLPTLVPPTPPTPPPAVVPPADGVDQ